MLGFFTILPSLELRTLSIATPERCLALRSAALRKQCETITAFDNEIALVPERLEEDDATALAAALHADVTKIGERWRLFRRDSTSLALRKADDQWFAERIAETVAREKVTVKALNGPEVEAPFAAMKAARARFEASADSRVDDSAVAAVQVSPCALLLADLLRRTPANTLRTAPGTFAVFSNSPVGTEFPLPVPSEALDAYDMRQRRFAEWSESALAAGQIPAPYRSAFPSRAFREGSRTLQLYVRREGDEVAFGLSVFDSEGRREAGASLMARDPNEKPAPKPDASRLGTVELPATTLEEIAKATPGNATFAVSTLDPTLREPLDVVAREALILWARAKGHDRVVACVPDALLAGVRRCVKGSILDLDALSGELDRAGCESLLVGGDFVIRPAQPLQEEATRIDRRPFSTLFRAGASGRTTWEDFAVYHAAFADTYEFRPALPLIERPIFDAFSLDSSSTRILPHALLATLGMLDPSERQGIMAGGRASLREERYSRCLLALARYASFSGPAPTSTEGLVVGSVRASAGGSDLDRTVTRLLARASDRWLTAAPSGTYTLIRRVSRTTGKGLDPDFAPQLFVIGGNTDPNSLRVIDENYRFLWAEERATNVRILLGPSEQIGPFPLRLRGRTSASPVPLDQVPNLEFARPSR